MVVIKDLFRLLALGCTLNTLLGANSLTVIARTASFRLEVCGIERCRVLLSLFSVARLEGTRRVIVSLLLSFFFDGHRHILGVGRELDSEGDLIA